MPEGYRYVKTVGKAKIYANGDFYISPDRDGHIGGVWKGAKNIKDLLKERKTGGTYNENLERIGG